jgi:hypothetical protein
MAADPAGYNNKRPSSARSGRFDESGATTG